MTNALVTNAVLAVLLAELPTTPDWLHPIDENSLTKTG